jgi:hypothetical protein
MTKRDVVQKELGQVPDAFLDEVLDFVQFLKRRIVRDSMNTAVASESALSKDWLRPEEDEAWQDL